MASSRHSLVVAMVMTIMHRCCCAAAPAAAAVNRTRAPALFVFGDSIVDAGNNNAITTLIRCNFAPYGKDFPGHNATGRFSNGKVPGDILDGHQAVLAGVPRRGAQRLRPPHWRHLRLRRMRLRPAHRRARVGSHHGQPAGPVQGIQGEAPARSRRAARRRDRVGEPVHGGHRHRRPRQHLLHHAVPARLRPRLLHRLRRPVRLGLHPEAARHGRAARERRRRAAHRVRAVAADQRRWARQGLRLAVQPGRRRVQRPARAGDRAAQRHGGGGGAGHRAQVHRPVHAAARHDPAPRRLRIRGDEPRLLRDGGVRGDADVQQVHGGCVQGRRQVPLLGHLPSHGERLQHPALADHNQIRLLNFCILIWQNFQRRK